MFISTPLLLILINVWAASSYQFQSRGENLPTAQLLATRKVKFVEIEQTIPKYGWKHGGDGGNPFDDQAEIEFSAGTPCIGVEVIERPDFLGGLRFLYGSDVDHAQWSSFHGDANAPSSSKENFMMEAGERITQITTYVGNRKWSNGVDTGTFVLGIRFGTNKGRLSRVFGSKDGEKNVETQDDYVFGYATGRSGFLLDELLVVWKNRETVKLNADNRFTALCPESPESLTLAVISAFYRNKEKPKSEVKDVGNRVRQRCDNEKSCTFIVADKVLKKIPCESCEKELEVTYTCSSQELIFGPELNDRLYKGGNIIIDGKKYITGMDNYLLCGEYCLKKPRCVGIQFGPNRECYLKSALEGYFEENGWLSMAVVNRSRDT